MAKSTQRPASWPKTESLAVQILIDMRWPNGLVCPYCGQHDPTRFSTTGGRDAHECLECLRQFRWTNGTIFYKSAMPYRKWLDCAWEVANDWDINSLELSRRVDIGNHTSWRLLRKIKAAAQIGAWEWQPIGEEKRALSLVKCLTQADLEEVKELLAKWDEERPKRKPPEVKDVE